MYPAPSALIHVPNVNIIKHADYNMYNIYIYTWYAIGWEITSWDRLGIRYWCIYKCYMWCWKMSLDDIKLNFCACVCVWKVWEECVLLGLFTRWHVSSCGFWAKRIYHIENHIWIHYTLSSSRLMPQFFVCFSSAYVNQCSYMLLSYPVKLQ